MAEARQNNGEIGQKMGVVLCLWTALTKINFPEITSSEIRIYQYCQRIAGPAYDSWVLVGQYLIISFILAALCQSGK